MKCPNCGKEVDKLYFNPLKVATEQLCHGCYLIVVVIPNKKIEAKKK